MSLPTFTVRWISSTRWRQSVHLREATAEKEVTVERLEIFKATHPVLVDREEEAGEKTG